eukprot:m51a1_g12676 hypothetical protein (254) ;mRNA; r:627-1388
MHYHRAHRLGYRVAFLHNGVVPAAFARRHTTPCVRFHAFALPPGHKNLFNARYYGLLDALLSSANTSSGSTRRPRYVMHQDVDSFCYNHPFDWMERVLVGPRTSVLYYHAKTAVETRLGFQRQLDRCFSAYRVTAAHMHFLYTPEVAGHYDVVLERVRHVVELLDGVPADRQRHACDQGAIALSFVLRTPDPETTHLVNRYEDPRSVYSGCAHVRDCEHIANECRTVMKRTGRTDIFRYVGDSGGPGPLIRCG